MNYPILLLLFAFMNSALCATINLDASLPKTVNWDGSITFTSASIEDYAFIFATQPRPHLSAPKVMKFSGTGHAYPCSELTVAYVRSEPEKHADDFIEFDNAMLGYSTLQVEEFKALAAKHGLTSNTFLTTGSGHPVIEGASKDLYIHSFITGSQPNHTTITNPNGIHIYVLHEIEAAYGIKVYSVQLMTIVNP